jgi:hypothetical protein
MSRCWIRLLAVVGVACCAVVGELIPYLVEDFVCGRERIFCSSVRLPTWKVSRRFRDVGFHLSLIVASAKTRGGWAATRRRCLPRAMFANTDCGLQFPILSI